MSPMELDNRGGHDSRHVSQPSSTSTVIMDESTRPRSDSAPGVEEKVDRFIDHDSLVTVRLSEPPYLQINTSVPANGLPSRKSLYGDGYTAVGTKVELVKGEEGPVEEDLAVRGAVDMEGEDGAHMASISDHIPNLHDELGGREKTPGDTCSTYSTSDDTDIGLQDADEDSASDLDHPRSSEETNWDQLQQFEDEESRDQTSDNSTAMLLARLEQENNLLATNPKTAKVQYVEKQQSPKKRKTRPPSMAQLRQMVNGPQPAALRYSVLPPPPMTDLQFYAALVRDYHQTAARLPTLLTNKIRKGIPPPLRGIVWQSMCSAQDRSLHEAFERLSGESSPYEGIIGKDLGRSFPGVDMFRDPEGEGQRSLGRVLKCFSLYDQKIGYCQGLAFLVGPLLMHMSDKEAFCVLVRLMENYDLRDCFLPDLAGLHVRIYQFGELLRQHLPILWAHLEDLQVDPAYVSQWFLSFFAVTCPLPMLFRIYDVIFAEGASETIMRVALSVMHKNEDRILACTELENVVQLLLSRSLWGCYNYNADELVDHFVGLSDVITRERLAALEQGYRVSQLSNSANTIAAGSGANTLEPADEARALDIATAASRFLGRIWASTSSSPKLSTSASTTTSNLSPGLTVAASRPLSMLRRTISKQSLASTLNSVEAGSSAPSSSTASVLSSASTESTLISRDSTVGDETSIRESAPSFTGLGPKATIIVSSGSDDEDKRNLHGQIEDLLTALSELQRNHALLADQLQREREERDEDKKAVRLLLEGLRRKAGSTTSDEISEEDAKRSDEDAQTIQERLSSLFDNVEQRFDDGDGSRRSSITETKSQLRDQLGRAKEQLSNETARGQEYKRKIYEMEQEVSNVTDQLKESRGHVRTLHQEKQRLERQIHSMRVRASDSTPSSTYNENGTWFSQATGLGTSPSSISLGGLRELKLSRSKSTPSQSTPMHNKRASSLMLQMAPDPTRDFMVPVPPAAPTNENDDLLHELVVAKTAEAVAKQEAEEAKQSLEQLRKALGLAHGEVPSILAHGNANANAAATQQASAASSGAMGMFGRLTGSSPLDHLSPAAAAAAPPNRPAAPVRAATTTPTPPAQGGGGFWGWRR